MFIVRGGVCIGLCRLTTFPLGLEDFIQDEPSTEFQEQIEAACGDAMDPVSGTMSEDGMQKCQEVVLGDNDFGNLLRDIYHHPEKYCKCMATFGEAVPECLLPLPIPDLEDAKLPLSLFKKGVCLLEIGCDAIDDVCVSELKSLDDCLPASIDDTVSCATVTEACESLESPPFSMMLPPEVTESKLPDACERVAQESKTDNNVVERYAEFNAKCNPSSFASSETTTSAYTVVQKESTTMALPFVVAGILLAIAAVMAVVVLKKRSANDAREQFDPVMVEDNELI
jgi:hypothetical protein